MGADGVTELPLIGQILSHWRVVDFGDVLDNGTRNGIYKPKAFHGRGAKIVNMGELFAYPRLRPVEMRRVELSNDELTRSKLESGDLLFARRSLVAEGAGKCSIVLEVDEPTTFESSIIRARPDRQQADSLFLYYLFSSPFGAYSLGSILRHVAVAGITGSDLVNLPIPLPPLSEQRAIVHILGMLDDKIELNSRMNETLEEMARAIFKSWFVDFDPVRAKAEGWDTGLPEHIADLFPDRFENSELGEIPVGWKVGTLDEVMEVNPRRPLRKGELAPYLDMKNMPTQSARALHVYEREFGSGVRFTDNATLVARITPCLENGKLCFVDFLGEGNIGWGSTEYIILRPNPPLPVEFAYFLARTEKFRTYAISNMSGTSGRQRVPADRLDRFALAVPSAGVAEHFGKTARTIISSMKAKDTESLTLAVIRDALLPRLISGKLRVGEAGRILERRI